MEQILARSMQKSMFFRNSLGLRLFFFFFSPGRTFSCYTRSVRMNIYIFYGQGRKITPCRLIFISVWARSSFLFYGSSLAQAKNFVPYRPLSCSPIIPPSKVHPSLSPLSIPKNIIESANHKVCFPNQ